MRRGHVRWMLAAALALMASPAMVRAHDRGEMKRSEPARASGKVRDTQASTTGSRSGGGTSSPNSQGNTDSSEGARIAGEVIGGCCAAMFSSAGETHTPSQPDPPNVGSAPSTPSHADGGPFDVGAARVACKQAEERAERDCPAPTRAEVMRRVRVHFEPDGHASGVEFEPAWHGETAECFARVFADVRVPPFFGDPATVEKTLRATIPGEGK